MQRTEPSSQIGLGLHPSTLTSSACGQDDPDQDAPCGITRKLHFDRTSIRELRDACARGWWDYEQGDVCQHQSAILPTPFLSFSSFQGCFHAYIASGPRHQPPPLFEVSAISPMSRAKPPYGRPSRTRVGASSSRRERGIDHRQHGVQRANIKAISSSCR